MATRYVSSNPAGSNTSPYDTLAKAATTFATAITGASAGDVFAFSNLHSESLGASTTYTLPGTLASPNQMYSFDNTQTTISSTNLLAGASLATTTNFNLTLSGVCSECVGFTFAAGSGANTAVLTIAGAAGNAWRLYNCTLQKLSTNGGASAITMGAGGQNLVELHNTTVQFGATGDQLKIIAGFRWVNTPSAIQGGTLPTTLFNFATALQNIAFCEGVDFSALSGKTLVNNNVQNQVVLKDCKLPSSVTVATAPASPGTDQVYAIRCDSAGTNYLFNAFRYAGNISTEISITRSGGSSTPAGQAFSTKIVTNANALWTIPCEAMSLATWNTSTGSKNVTIYGTINSGTLPNNDEIWIEAEYLKDAGDPLGGFVNSTKANNLASGVAVSSDSSSWNGGGSGAGWSPFKLTVSITPLLTGPVTVRVFAGKASTTYYIDSHVYFT